MGNYIGPDPSAQKDTQNRVTYVATDGQTTFSAVYTPGYIDVYQNGVKLQNTDFTALNGTTFVLGTAAIAGDVVEYVAIKASSPYDFYTKAQADLRSDNFYGVALGTGDAMTVTLTPTPTSLVDGMEIKVRVPAANSSNAPALTIMVLGVSKTIYKWGGKTIAPLEWSTGQEITLRYNQTADRFELMSKGRGFGEKFTLTDAATVTPDIYNYQAFNWTIGGSRTVGFPSQVPPSGVMYIDATVNSTGGYTLTFASGYNVVPGYSFDGSANKINRIWFTVRTQAIIDVYIEQLN